MQNNTEQAPGRRARRGSWPFPTALPGAGDGSEQGLDGRARQDRERAARVYSGADAQRQQRRLRERRGGQFGKALGWLGIGIGIGVGRLLR